MTLLSLADAFLINPPVRISKGTTTPFVAMGDVEPFRRDVRASNVRPYSGGAKFMPGDIVMARITPSLENGKISRYVSGDEMPAAGSTEFIVIRGRDRVSDTSFAYYVFTSTEIREFAISQMNGSSGRQRVQTDSLANYKIALPILSEQRAIAATLGALDDKIESNRRAILLINNFLDSKAFLLGNELPTVALGDLVSSSTLTISPLKLGEQLVDHFSLPAFDSMHMPERISANKIMSSKLAISETCILISRLNPRINRTWFAVPERGYPALASTEFLCVLPKGRVEIGAIWLALRDEFFISELRRRVTGTSGSHQRVRPTDALAIEIPDVRKINETEKLETTTLLEIAHQKQVENQRLSRLRDSLLPELLSGRVRVGVAKEVTS